MKELYATDNHAVLCLMAALISDINMDKFPEEITSSNQCYQNYLLTRRESQSKIASRN